MTTPDERAKIAALLERTTLCTGLGRGERPDGKVDACSVAAINLALTGELTDRIPDCMSNVVGRWVIAIQDRMPDDIRNSVEWRTALIQAAGTGRDHEDVRQEMVLAWMWDGLEPLTDKLPMSAQPAWRAMCAKRTAESARQAWNECCAYAAAAAAAYYAAAYAAAYADAYYYAAAAAAYAAAAYADAYYAAYAAALAAYWKKLNPAGLLAALNAVSDTAGPVAA